jgi:hypothetical protein
MSQANEIKPDERLLVTNEMRLSLREWFVVVAIVASVLVATPRIWKHVERFDTGPDYRIPYLLSNDYWLFDWRLEKTDANKPIVVLGDSVVWGQYVKSDGTLSHFLSEQASRPDRFVNAGVNGLYPLAMEGLVRYYGDSLRNRKVMVLCNFLWLSSPQADMQTTKAGSINHASLLPQFLPRIPSYQADANDRLGAVIQRNVSFMSWVSHLQDCYFQQQGILKWTLAENRNRSRDYPNVYKNPLAQITLVLPSGQDDEVDRGPGGPDHKPWTANGGRKTTFDWVPLESSLQWAAFQRTLKLLQDRGNDVLVIVAPFNGHMIADKSMDGYTAIHRAAAAWLSEHGIAYVAPELLPSDLYADASHPLTAGYELLAKSIFQAPDLRKWIGE